MQNQKAPLIAQFLLGLFIFLLILPLFFLFGSPGADTELVEELFTLARWNTTCLALGVLVMTTSLGGGFAFLHAFYNFPFKKALHTLMLMPLAFPAYVFAFIYLGQFGPSTLWSNYVEVQGELWFLVFVLSLALTPYVYYFSCLGLRGVSQSEVETETLLKGGSWRFFSYNVWPKWAPFLISAQILVLFESLSDFGAASVINVPVITTMIYKLWFDLFSYAAAAQLSLKYSLIILLFLIVEFIFKRSQDRQISTQRDPLIGKALPQWGQAIVVVSLFGFVIMAFLWPTLKVILWAIQGSQWTLWVDTFWGAGNTVGVGLITGVLVVLLACCIHFPLRWQRWDSKLWTLVSTIGYSLPGSILAVAVYGLLLKTTNSITSSFLLGGLVLGLVYKFLTVGMRPIGEAAYCLPQDLIDLSRVLNVSVWQKLKVFYYPSLRETGTIALLLVIIEVMKEMPLTLMLAPSEFQTLSIKIFNFTSEGEWEKAALPSLLLIVVGVASVTLINLRRENS